MTLAAASPWSWAAVATTCDHQLGRKIPAIRQPAAGDNAAIVASLALAGQGNAIHQAGKGGRSHSAADLVVLRRVDAPETDAYTGHVEGVPVDDAPNRASSGSVAVTVPGMARRAARSAVRSQAVTTIPAPAARVPGTMSAVPRLPHEAPTG